MMASDESTQDPLDKAILVKAGQEMLDLHINETRQKIHPLRTSHKTIRSNFNENRHTLRVLKGAPQVIRRFDLKLNEQFPKMVASLASRGLRVLAIASGTERVVQVAGLIAFQDPPRPDSASLMLA